MKNRSLILPLFVVATGFIGGCSGNDKKEALKNLPAKNFQQIKVDRYTFIDNRTDEFSKRKITNHEDFLFRVNNGTD